jgi:hypothetical protein
MVSTALLVVTRARQSAPNQHCRDGRTDITTWTTGCRAAPQPAIPRSRVISDRGSPRSRHASLHDRPVDPMTLKAGGPLAAPVGVAPTPLACPRRAIATRCARHPHRDDGQRSRCPRYSSRSTALCAARGERTHRARSESDPSVPARTCGKLIDLPRCHRSVSLPRLARGDRSRSTLADWSSSSCNLFRAFDKAEPAHKLLVRAALGAKPSADRLAVEPDVEPHTQDRILVGADLLVHEPHRRLASMLARRGTP